MLKLSSGTKVCDTMHAASVSAIDFAGPSMNVLHLLLQIMLELCLQHLS